MTILTTDRLILRPARASDAADLFEVFGDAETMRYWSTPPDETLAQTQERVDRMIPAPDPVTYFVAEHQGRAAGTLGLWQGTEVGFILRRDLWRKGLMAEAMATLIPYLWRVTQVPCLTADADPLNDASVSFLRALGFRETHRAKRTFFVNGVWADSVYFRLDRPGA